MLFMQAQFSCHLRKAINGPCQGDFSGSKALEETKVVVGLVMGVAFVVDVVMVVEVLAVVVMVMVLVAWWWWWWC